MSGIDSDQISSLEGGARGQTDPGLAPIHGPGLE